MSEPIFTPCARDAFVAAVERHRGRLLILAGDEYGEIPTECSGLMRLVRHYRRNGEWGVDEPRLFGPAPFPVTKEEREWAAPISAA